MRIAMLSWESLHSVAVGGVSAHVTELAAALVRKGHQVHVFTRRAPLQRGHDWIDGVHYHRCLYPSHPDFVDDVNNMCRSFVDRVFEVEDFLGRFDIVHAHDWLAANAMIWIKQGRGHRCVLTIHATEYGRCSNCFHNGRSQRIRDQERAGTYWADRVIAVSHAIRKEIAWMYEVPDGKTSAIYNGVSPHRFEGPVDAGGVKRRYQIGPTDPTVLFCGRLTHQKGPDLLVEAIPSVLRFHPRAKFIFAGDGEMRGALEGRARRLGAADAVRFLGYRSGEELVNLFKCCETTCVPSRNEPFGIVVLEAWSARKPVIVTQNGGPNEYVRHEENGLKIFPRVDSIAWGLGTLFQNFDRARWMGQNGRRLVEEQFTWDRIADHTLEAYDPQGVLRGQRPAPVAPVASAAPSASAAPAAPSAIPLLERPALRDRPARLPASAMPQGRPLGWIGGPRVAVELSVGWASGAALAHRTVRACQETLAALGFSARFDGQAMRIEGAWDAICAAVHLCFRAVGEIGGAPLTTTVQVAGALHDGRPAGWRGVWIGPLFAGAPAPADRPAPEERKVPIRVEAEPALAGVLAADASEGGGNGDR